MIIFQLLTRMPLPFRVLHVYKLNFGEIVVGVHRHDRREVAASLEYTAGDIGSFSGVRAGLEVL